MHLTAGMGTVYNGSDLSKFYLAYRVSGYSPLLVGEPMVSWRK